MTQSSLNFSDDSGVDLSNLGDVWDADSISRWAKHYCWAKTQGQTNKINPVMLFAIIQYLLSEQRHSRISGSEIMEVYPADAKERAYNYQLKNLAEGGLLERSNENNGYMYALPKGKEVAPLFQDDETNVYIGTSSNVTDYSSEQIRAGWEDILLPMLSRVTGFKSNPFFSFGDTVLSVAIFGLITYTSKLTVGYGEFTIITAVTLWLLFSVAFSATIVGAGKYLLGEYFDILDQVHSLPRR